MRIAQVAPLYESVPPKLYGGTERIVSYITEELVRLGHDVTLFASADSNTRARLIPGCAQALRLADVKDQVAPHLALIERVYKLANEFDLIHFHLDYLHFPISRRENRATVTTLHGRLDLPEIEPLHREFKEMPLISISEAQRIPLSFSNWQGTVHHGLPPHLLHFHPQPEGYLAFLGRISPEKRVDLAIEIAQKAGHRLRIAAKIDRADAVYFETIRSLFFEPCVEYIGEISDREKNGFLGNAKALIFPIDWPEPFGLVMIEALACGTPVIAFERGSVNEILEHGKTGFIVRTVEEAVQAVGRLNEIDRSYCRKAFESRFSAERMARNYVCIYEQILAARNGDWRQHG